jgi:hypothetical protein
MLNPDDLRIGNFYLNPAGNPVFCTGVPMQDREFLVDPWLDPEDGALKGHAPEDCDGIPITPEILLGADFTERPDRTYTIIAGQFILGWSIETGVFLQRKDQQLPMEHIDTVHALQNLFIDLAGDDLPLQLEEPISYTEVTPAGRLYQYIIPTLTELIVEFEEKHNKEPEAIYLHETDYHLLRKQQRTHHELYLPCNLNGIPVHLDEGGTEGIYILE